jgi:16S rRNA (cytidine1402-2'-O)-methyltransferase
MPGSPGAGLNTGGGVLVAAARGPDNPAHPVSATAASVAASSRAGRIDERKNEGSTLAETGTPGMMPEEAAAGRAFRAEPGALYVVGTPIGNLRDVGLRALDILRTADVVAAEDTRVTAKLLQHYGIATRPVSVREHNEARVAGGIVEALRAGRSVALVSDAGTPAVSDPGARLVRAVREAGLRVIPVPGPSALVSAIAAAGLRAERFAFLGFLPQQAKARAALLAPLAHLPLALVLYEAPHRVAATVDALHAALGAREITFARELTKAFETIATLPLHDAAAWLAADANRVRGEFVLIVDAPVEAAAGVLDAQVERWLAALLSELPPARAARVVAEVSGVPRDAVYARALALKDPRG